MEKNKRRKSNFELLRILAIIMIIFYHFAYHGEFNFDINTISINRLWIQFIEMGGKIGVNIFILISGYFMIDAKTIRISKLIKLLGQLIFTSTILYVIFIICKAETFSLKGLIKAFLPVTYKEWWFASTYFVLYLLSPFINILINKINKEMYKKMIITMFIGWSLIPTIFDASFQSNDLLWFIFLYCLAGYIRLYFDDVRISSKKLLIFCFGMILVTYLSVLILDFIGLKYTLIAKHTTFFYGMQKMPILLISVLIFFIFKNMKIKYIKSINILSQATFGVYLIHDSNLVRPFLWNNIFHNAAYQDNSILIVYSIFACIAVYIICTIIELIRINLIEKTFLKYINKNEQKINNKLKKLSNLKILKRI